MINIKPRIVVSNVPVRLPSKRQAAVGTGANVVVQRQASSVARARDTMVIDERVCARLFCFLFVVVALSMDHWCRGDTHRSL